MGVALSLSLKIVEDSWHCVAVIGRKGQFTMEWHQSLVDVWYQSMLLKKWYMYWYQCKLTRKVYIMLTLCTILHHPQEWSCFGMVCNVLPRHFCIPKTSLCSFRSPKGAPLGLMTSGWNGKLWRCALKLAEAWWSRTNSRTSSERFPQVMHR